VRTPSQNERKSLLDRIGQEAAIHTTCFYISGVYARAETTGLGISFDDPQRDGSDNNGMQGKYDPPARFGPLILMIDRRACTTQHS
jgi:hypothetical protein